MTKRCLALHPRQNGAAARLTVIAWLSFRLEPTQRSTGRICRRPPSAPRGDVFKGVTAHTFSECIATHLIEPGCDIQTVRELFGRNDVRSEMVYIHAMNRGVRGGVSLAGIDTRTPIRSPMTLSRDHAMSKTSSSSPTARQCAIDVK